MTVALLALLLVQEPDHSKRPASECVDEGLALYKAGKYEEARKEFDHALSKTPEDGNARYNRGLALYVLKKYDLALVDFSWTTILLPQFAAGWLQLGYTHYCLEHWEAAARGMEEAIRLDPKKAGDCKKYLDYAKSRPAANLNAGDPRALWGHAGAVSFAAFSPSGDKLFTYGVDGRARWWDWSKGESKSSVVKGGFLAVSSDLRWIATRVPDLLDTDTGSRKALEGDASDIATDILVFSPDDRLVAGGGFDGYLRIWDRDTGALRRKSEAVVVWLRFSPDGKTLAGEDGESLGIWDVATGERKARLALKNSAGRIHFHPDGRVFSLRKNSVVLWDPVSNRTETYDSNGARLLGSGVSPDGRWFAAGTDEGKLEFWSAPGKPAKTVQAHAGAVNYVSFSRDGKWIATAGSDGSAKVWSAAALLGGSMSRWDYEWDSWKDFPVGAWIKIEVEESDDWDSWKYVELWELTETKADSLRIRITRNGSSSIKIVPKGERSEFCTLCGKYKADHRTPTGEKAERLKVGSQELDGVRVSFKWKACAKTYSDYEFASTYSRSVPGWTVTQGSWWKVLDFGLAKSTPKELLDKALRLLEEGKPREAIEPLDQLLNEEPKNAEAWKQRGWAYLDLSEFANALYNFDQAIALAPKDALAWGLRGELRYRLEHWEACIRDFEEAGRLDAEEAKVVQPMLATARTRKAAGERLLPGDRWKPAALAVNPDGSLVVAASISGVDVWDVTSGRSVRKLEKRTDASAVAFSPDGARLAAGYSDGTIQVWNTSTWRTAEVRGAWSGLGTLSFQSDSKRLVAGGTRVKCLDLGEKGEVQFDQGGRAAFLSDGRVAIGSDDGSLTLIDPSTKKSTTYKAHIGSVTAVAAGPGDRIATAARYENSIQIWRGGKARKLRIEADTLAFSADGAVLMVGNEKSTRFIDVETAIEFLAMRGGWSATLGPSLLLVGDPVGAIHLRPIGDALTAGPKRAKKALEEYERAVKLAGKGDLDGAEKAYGSAIAQNPRMGAAYLDRGSVRLQLFRAEEAFEDYSRAIEILPFEPNAHLGLGLCRALQSEKSPKEKELLREAEASLIRAVALADFGSTERSNAERALKEVRRKLQK